MKLCLAMSVLAGTCSLSVAAPVTGADWGLHDAFESASVQPIGKFDNTFFFTLARELELFSGAVSNNRQRPADLKGGLVSLFRLADSPDGLPIDSYTFDGSTESAVHEFGRLAAGDYRYEVSGMGTGANGGAYTIRSMVQDTNPDGGFALTTPPTPALVPALELAVPEPQSGMLALAGLGALVLRQKRRKLLAQRCGTRLS